MSRLSALLGMFSVITHPLTLSAAPMLESDGVVATSVGSAWITPIGGLFALLGAAALLFHLLRSGRTQLQLERERQALQQQLQLCQGRLDTLLTLLPEGVVIHDQTGRITACNPAAERILALPQAEMVADPSGGMGWPLLDAEGGRLAPSAHPAAVTQSSGEPLRNLILGLQRDNSPPRWLAIHSQPLPAPLGGFLLTYTDITERRKAEAARRAQEVDYRELVEGANNIIIRWDADGTLRYINEFGRHFFGYEPGELEGHNVLGTIVPTDGEQTDLAAMIEEIASHPEQFERNENENMRKDGSRVFISWTNRPLLDHEGRCIELLSIGADVSDRHQAELELKRSNADLEQFAYAISHDLRQPLRMVTSYMQLLERALAGQLEEETRQFLHFASDGAKRMDLMLTSLLEYSRVGRKTEPLALLESRETLEEALAFLQPTIAETKAEIQVSGLWPKLTASRDELTRLFQNLVGNALKYQPQDHTPFIQISAEWAGREWLFSVADNGIGINPAQVDRLFQVFSRLQARSRYEGSGVGLALCRKIVEHHGGRIWVESMGEGQGTVFRFTLPAQERPTPPAAAPRSAP